MPLQPVVERRLAAVEVVDAMLLPERLGPPVSHALRAREDARLGEELLEAGLLLRRAVQELDEALPLLRFEHELRPIRQHALGLDDCCVDHEVRQRPLRGFSRLPDELIRLGRNAKVPTLLDLCHGLTVHTTSVQRKWILPIAGTTELDSLQGTYASLDASASLRLSRGG